MITEVIAAGIRIEVVPHVVVHGHSHFRWIPVVQILVTPVILASTEVLRIVHVRIMVEAIPIVGTVDVTPYTSKCSLTSLGIL